MYDDAVLHIRTNCVRPDFLRSNTEEQQHVNDHESVVDQDLQDEVDWLISSAVN